MGRPKEFDRDLILSKATGVFQRHGFSATSTQQLVERLGINRKSMYAGSAASRDSSRPCSRDMTR